MRTLAALVLAALLVPGVAPVQGGGDWPAYRHDNHSTWYNPAAFSPADALALKPDWTFTVASSTFAEPVMGGGAVYYTTAGTRGGSIYSLDATTGAQRWLRTFPNSPTTCNGVSTRAGIQGAATVANGVVYIGAADGFLYALSAATGATLWGVQIANTNAGEIMIDSPVVSTALGKVFIGTSAGAEACLISPHIAAVDLATGKAVSRTFLGAGHTGASIWSSLTVDEDAQRVYAATGNTNTGPSGDPLSQAIVAFDAATLSVLDHWQVPTRFTTDADFGASPTLFNAADGTPLVGTANKDGFIYVLRRANLAAGPVWKYPIAIYGGPEAGQSSVVAPSFADGVLYGGGAQTPQNELGSVVAFNPGTGAVLWKHVTPGFVLPGMPILGQVIFVAATHQGNTGATIEMLDRATGAVIRQIDTAAPVWGAPSAGDGKLLFTEISGHLHVYSSPATAVDGGVPDAGGPGPGDAGTPGPDGGLPDAGGPGPGDAGTPGTDGGVPDGGPGETVLFHDSLTGSGPLGSQWIVGSGNFARGPSGTSSTGVHNYAFVSAAALASETASVTINPVAGSNYNGLLIHASASSPVANHYAGYRNSDGTFSIARRNGYTYSYLGSTAPLPLTPGEHWLVFRASDAPGTVQLTLLLDSAPVLSVADSSAQQLTSGLGGIFSYNNAGSRFRDLVLETP